MSTFTSAVSYRALLTFDVTADVVFRSVDEQIRSWLQSKSYAWDGGFAGYARFSPGAFAEASERRERDGSRTSRFRLVEENSTGSWIVRITVHAAAGSAPWTLVEVLSPQGDDLTRSVAAAPPRIVRHLLEVLPGRDGATQMTCEPTLVRADGVADLVAAVSDPKRRGLVFVAGTPADFPIAGWKDFIAPLVRDTVGLASTFVLDAEATTQMRQALGAHGPEEGTLRTYLRDVDTGSHLDAIRHRFMTARTLVDRPRGYLRKVLSGAARREVVDRPLPSDVARVLRRVARWDADLETEQPPPRAPRTADRVEHARERLATTDMGDQAEVYLALQDALSALGSPASQVNVAGVEALASAAQRGRSVEQSAQRLRSQLEETQRELEAQQDETSLRLGEAEDAALEAAAAIEEQQTAEDQVRYLRNELMRANAGEIAWSAVPDEHRTRLPDSMSELLERTSEFSYVQFTGDPQAVLELDVTDTLGRSPRKAWQALRALEDYARLKSEAAFVGTVHDYCRETPGGCQGWSAERHAYDESETVKKNARFAAARTLPVPHDVAREGVVFMGAHFKLVTQRTVTPRMHYYDDTAGSGLVYVGYLGRHLPNNQTN